MRQTLLGSRPSLHPYCPVIADVCAKITDRHNLEVFILSLVHSQGPDGSRPSTLTVEKIATVSIFAEYVYVCLSH